MAAPDGSCYGSRMEARTRLPWVWDYDLDEADFRALLAGERCMGSLDQTWAVLRLLEYAPWPQIVHFLGYRALVEGWPRWRPRLRSVSRRRGFDFLAQWLPRHHPELLA